MKKKFLMITVSFIAQAASAYEVGTFSCPNLANLPDNVYQLQKINVGDDTLPYLKATRYYQINLKSPVKKVEIKGIANVVITDEGEELTVGNVYLRFDNGRLKNCTFTP